MAMTLPARVDRAVETQTQHAVRGNGGNKGPSECDASEREHPGRAGVFRKAADEREGQMCADGERQREPNADRKRYLEDRPRAYPSRSISSRAARAKIGNAAPATSPGITVSISVMRSDALNRPTRARALAMTAVRTTATRSAAGPAWLRERMSLSSTLES